VLFEKLQFPAIPITVSEILLHLSLIAKDFASISVLFWHIHTICDYGA